jgi:hypothetical protein
VTFGVFLEFSRNQKDSKIRELNQRSFLHDGWHQFFENGSFVAKWVLAFSHNASSPKKRDHGRATIIAVRSEMARTPVFRDKLPILKMFGA